MKEKDKEFDGTIIQFLNGSHSIDGIWFGEKHPKKEGAFWWRNNLDEFIWQQNQKINKLEQIAGTAKQMLDCLMTDQEIRLWQNHRSWGKIASWKEQALSQIELFQKLHNELK